MDDLAGASTQCKDLSELEERELNVINRLENQIKVKYGLLTRKLRIEKMEQIAKQLEQETTISTISVEEEKKRQQKINILMQLYRHLKNEGEIIQDAITIKDRDGRDVCRYKITIKRENILPSNEVDEVYHSINYNMLRGIVSRKTNGLLTEPCSAIIYRRNKESLHSTDEVDDEQYKTNKTGSQNTPKPGKNAVETTTHKRKLSEISDTNRKKVATTENQCNEQESFIEESKPIILKEQPNIEGTNSESPIIKKLVLSEIDNSNFTEALQLVAGKSPHQEFDKSFQNPQEDNDESGDSDILILFQS